MSFCTVVEWDQNVSDELSKHSGDDALPDGAVVRIVGATDTGTYVIELWDSEDHARRFGERNVPAVEQPSLPPPTRVFGFRTSRALVRGGGSG